MGGQGAKFLAMALCLGPGGKGLVWYIFAYMKGENWGQGSQGPLDLLLIVT